MSRQELCAPAAHTMMASSSKVETSWNVVFCSVGSSFLTDSIHVASVGLIFPTAVGLPACLLRRPISTEADSLWSTERSVQAESPHLVLDVLEVEQNGV